MIEVDPGTGGLCTYVRLRSGTAAHSLDVPSCNVRAYKDAQSTVVAFELCDGYEPIYNEMVTTFHLSDHEQQELERLWPLIMKDHRYSKSKRMTPPKAQGRGRCPYPSAAAYDLSRRFGSSLDLFSVRFSEVGYVRGRLCVSDASTQRCRASWC